MNELAIALARATETANNLSMEKQLVNMIAVVARSYKKNQPDFDEKLAQDLIYFAEKPEKAEAYTEYLIEEDEDVASGLFDPVEESALNFECIQD